MCGQAGIGQNCPLMILLAHGCVLLCNRPGMSGGNGWLLHVLTAMIDEKEPWNDHMVFTGKSPLAAPLSTRH